MLAGLGRRYVDVVSKAVEASRVSFYVQGIHDVLDTDVVLYDEALARIVDTSGRLIEASEFVPALEVLKQTFLLDRCMIGLVLDQLEADRQISLGCNISADTFDREDGWHQIITEIEARRHLAQRLVIEITETRPLGLMSVLRSRLEQAQKLGCRIAIDDFGAGYFSPIQLYSIRPDIVKLDACFLWKMRDSNNDSSSLERFVSFASCFASIVVVEGVENEDDLRRAAKAGATHVQGWYLSRPAALERGGV